MQARLSEAGFGEKKANTYVFEPDFILNVPHTLDVKKWSKYFQNYYGFDIFLISVKNKPY